MGSAYSSRQLSTCLSANSSTSATTVGSESSTATSILEWRDLGHVVDPSDNPLPEFDVEALPYASSSFVEEPIYVLSAIGRPT